MKSLHCRTEAERILSCLKGAHRRSGAPKMYRTLVKTAEELGWPHRFGISDERLMTESGIRSHKTFQKDLARLIRWGMIERKIHDVQKNHPPVYRLCPTEETRIPDRVPGLRSQIGAPPRKNSACDRSRSLEEFLSKVERLTSSPLSEPCRELVKLYFRRRGHSSIEEGRHLLRAVERFGLDKIKRAVIRNFRQQEYDWKVFWRMLTGVESSG